MLALKTLKWQDTARKRNEGPCEKESVKAVMEALNLNPMKTRQLVDPSGIAFELLKVSKNNNVNKFAKVANNLLQAKEMPESR